MKKNINQFFKIVSLALFGSLVMMNCEADADDLGEQFFDNSALDGVQENFDIVAYSRNNEDKIEADTRTLNIARLGAFKESVFGKQKASYLSQISLPSYSPNFGGNPVVDSVVLYMTPLYDANSSTEESTSFSYPDGDGGTITSTLKKITYPVSKYGNDSINAVPSVFNINVHEVTDFLKSTADTIYSNENFAYTTLLGTKEFKGNISSVKITKDEDSSTLFEANTSLRIPLDNNFFQTKILDQQGTDNLKDFASFIRHFKGLRISVVENDGYLFGIKPNDTRIKIYYKYDNDSGERKTATYSMNLGSGNVHIGEYEYDRTGSTVETALGTINSTDGDAKIYAQGMGGASAMLKIPAAVIATLRDKYENEKIGIIGAKIRLYTDESTWANDYAKPNSFVVLEDEATDYMSEFKNLANSPNYQFVRSYDLDKNPAYYDLTVTQTLKEAIEKNDTNEDIVLKLDLGSFIYTSNGYLSGIKYTSRPYEMNRVVFVGTDPSNDKRAQLQVIYAK